VLFAVAAALVGFGWPVTGARAKSPEFALHTADGTTRVGALRELTADWSIRVGSRSERVPGTAVVSLRRTNIALPAFPETSQILLANGGRLPGDLIKIADDRVHLRPAAPIQAGGNGDWSLPLSGVSALWLANPANVAEPERFLRRLARETRTRDVVLLRNGDRIEGTLVGLAGGTFRIKEEGEKVTELAVARVAVVGFNSDLVSSARPTGIYGSLVLVNGCRLVVGTASLADGGQTLEAKLPTGPAFTVALDQVAALDLRQGCALYLSDLKPKVYEHTPFLGVRWPFVADGSVADRDLRLAGNTYDKGIGLHSRSRLTYDLPEGCQAFEALVGLDDRTGRRGRVRIQVLRDGKSVKIDGNKELTGRDPPLSIRVDIRKVRQLTLVVDYGRFGDVQAHVNWVDARLIKSLGR
jgi:hypothetical protein